MKKTTYLITGILVTGFLSAIPAGAEEAPAAPAKPDIKALSGMSILGNDEAPTSLVIVPWKSSELGDGIGVGNLLDERASPVDRDVFMRELNYYQIRVVGSGQLPKGSAQ